MKAGRYGSMLARKLSKESIYNKFKHKIKISKSVYFTVCLQLPLRILGKQDFLSRLLVTFSSIQETEDRMSSNLGLSLFSSSQQPIPVLITQGIIMIRAAQTKMVKGGGIEEYLWYSWMVLKRLNTQICMEFSCTSLTAKLKRM